MNRHNRSHLLLYFLVSTALLMLFSSPLYSQPPYVTEKVSSADANPVILFQFNTPSGATGTDRFIMAKFVVDDTSSDLEFRLETATIAKYPITDFKISQGNVDLNDADSGNPVARLRVRDKSSTEDAATGYRIIRISLEYLDYTFAASETWRIRAKQPATGTLHFWGFWTEGTGESAMELEVTRPKLIPIIPDPTDFTALNAAGNFPEPYNISFGEVHIDLPINYAPEEKYEFHNVGTQKLTITGVSPAKDLLNEAYVPSNYPGSATPPVLPLGSLTGTTFKCNPKNNTGALPEENITITVSSSTITALHINLINNRGIRLNTAILLDLSGSMLTDLDGIWSYDYSTRLPTNAEE